MRKATAGVKAQRKYSRKLKKRKGAHKWRKVE